MTMHLVHPSLSMNGKRRGKQKFRNSEAAKAARQRDEEWKALQKRWGVEADEKKKSQGLRAKQLSYIPKIPVGRDTTAHIASKDSGIGNAAAPAAKVYTGEKILGVCTMHKSNAVPVFSKEEAIEISKMRRG